MAVETDSNSPSGDSHTIKEEIMADEDKVAAGANSGRHAEEDGPEEEEEEEVAGEAPRVPADLVPEPLRLTNFSILEILKPSFGKLKRRDSGSNNFSHQTVQGSSGHHRHSPAERHSRPEHCSKANLNCGKRDGTPVSPSAGCLSPRVSTPPHLGNLDSMSPVKARKPPILWPAWVYCTRYSDRPSSGPRSRKVKKREKKPDEKRPRTAFTNEQLARLKREFDENRYLTETRRQELAKELKLNESQIKIWFQNKRAKMKKATGVRNGLAMQLMAQGLYNHSTMSMDNDNDMAMAMEK